MSRAIIAALLCCLIAAPVSASEPPTPRELAESMRACEDIASIADSAERRGVVVRHATPLEDFVILSGPGVPNAESYRHWWNTELVLVFPRYATGWETPAPWPVLRERRNRTIQCFYAVPPVPDDYRE